MSRPGGRLAILRYHDALAFAVLRPVRTENDRVRACVFLC
jgi:hypothetical protein